MFEQIIKKKINENFFFRVFPSYLTIFLPFFLITGPFLSDLAISLCSIIFLINTFYYKNFFFYKNYFFKFFLIFWITLLISSLLAENYIFYSLKDSFFYIRFGLFALSTYYLILNNPKIILYFFYVLIFCFYLLVFDGFFQFFNETNLFGWPIISNRVSSFFKDELILGSYLSRLMPLCFACYVFVKRDFHKINIYFNYSIFLLFILCEILIFVSGERSAFFYLNISALYIIILSKNLKKIRILILLFSLLGIILISFFDNTYKKRIIDVTLNQVQKNTVNQNKNISTINKKHLINELNTFYLFSLEHENHFKSAYLMFKDNKIFGIGVKLFRKHCNIKKYITSFESCTTHPHNTYIQLLSEVGIIGFFQIFLIFFLLIFFSIKHFFLIFFKKKIYFDDFQICLLSSALITLWPLIPTGNFFSNWLSIIYYLPVGFFLYSLNKKKI